MTHNTRKRFHRLAFVALACWGGIACGGGDRAPVDDGVLEAFTEPGRALPGLSEEDRGRFLLGRALFERLATPAEGLGPLFNASRCSDCHGEPAVGGTSALLVTKVSRYESGRCSDLREFGGGNIQQRTTPALRERGILAEAVPAQATEQAVFLAPPLFGLGLLQAVAEADIVSREDPDDADGDGVSGRAGRTADGTLGRFGWKADSPTIAHFVDTAIRFEVGLTTPDFPVEEGVGGQPLPEGVDPAPEPEIDATGVALLVDYVRFLGAPGPDPTVAPSSEGAELFRSVGCESCHVAELRTDPSGPGGQTWAVRAYTDLLVHDMGEELASVCGGAASPLEIRTPPLWGLRHRDLLLHDGRAATVEEAILLHGGEGEGSRLRFEALDPEGRAALLRFVSSR